MPNEPLVEPSGRAEMEVTLRALEQRIRQQELLAELGVRALRGADFDQLLNETVRLTADGLRTSFCKVLEHVPSEHCFLVRAGVGWGEGVVGEATVGDDLESPAGYALRTKTPVISNHLENEERFRTPEILRRFGIRRAMNVILQGDNRPYGVLEVDSQSEDEFGKADLAFLQGAANLLGMAIERERRERALAAALEHHKVLLREINHRIKNSLSIVSSMLNLQAVRSSDENLTVQLKEAADRVVAVARAHEVLYQNADVQCLDIGKYIERISEDFENSFPNFTIAVSVDDGIDVATDKAICCALIVTELVTNAAKYAYGGGHGNIFVSLARTPNNGFSICVRDQGVGLPANFDVTKSKGLGMRLVTSFTQQLNGILDIHAANPGTEFVVRVPFLAAHG